MEVWQPIAPRPPDKPDPWTPPIERVGNSPQIRLARLIAARIQEMLDTRSTAIEGSADCAGRYHGAGTPPHGVHASARTRAEGAAAADRRRRPDAPTEQLAVMDLMALGKFALLPEMTLTLATV